MWWIFGQSFICLTILCLTILMNLYMFLLWSFHISLFICLLKLILIDLPYDSIHDEKCSPFRFFRNFNTICNVKKQHACVMRVFRAAYALSDQSFRGRGSVCVRGIRTFRLHDKMTFSFLSHWRFVRLAGPWNPKSPKSVSLYRKKLLKSIYKLLTIIFLQISK